VRIFTLYAWTDQPTDRHHLGGVDLRRVASTHCTWAVGPALSIILAAPKLLAIRCSRDLNIFR